MATKKKTSKVKDITGKKVSKKDLDKVKGGMYTRPKPTTTVNKPIYSATECKCGCTPASRLSSYKGAKADENG